jgi:hypothetical protein
LSRSVREGRTPEDEVRIIADKFPDASAQPCVHHGAIAFGELVERSLLPIRPQVVAAGGRTVLLDGKVGVVYSRSPESEAFSRWQERRFADVEHSIAKKWREMLASQ